MSEDHASERLAEAQDALGAGDVPGALETLDRALWTAVGRLDWPTVAAIEHLLAQAWTRVEKPKDRRRCQYLLHAARENLRAHAGDSGGERVDAEGAVRAHVDVDERVDRLERQLADLRGAALVSERRLQALELEVQALAGRRGRVPAAARPTAPPPRAAPPGPARPAPPVPPRPRPMHPPVRPPSPPRLRREIDWSQLFGARGLAWAGGVVTSLGVVFLYALAANRGWIGPVARVSTGAAVSALVFAAGFWLRRRYGTTYSALAAAGAGIVGGYATLLASVALYDLLPAWAALLVAGGIGAVGVATSLRWSAEMVAALGLVGAILVPLVGVADLGWTLLGTAFVLVVLAGAIAVAVTRRWAGVLVGAVAASAPQIAALLLDRADGDVALVVLAALFALAYLGGALLWDGGERELGRTTASLVLLSAAVATLASQQLFLGDLRGAALLAAAAGYGAVGAALFASSRRRDVSSLLVAVALALAAVGLAQLLSGQVLAAAWAAEAAVLAWLARRIGEERYQLGALAYLALAAGHVLFVDAPPSDFLTVTADPAGGVASVLAAAAAALVVARYAGAWPERAAAGGVLAPLAALFAALRASRTQVRAAAVALSATAVVYALSLGTLELAQRLAADDERAFDAGQAAVTAIWAGLALALLGGSLLRRVAGATAGALAWYGALLVKLVLLDAGLASTPRSVALLAAGASLVFAALLWQRLAVAGPSLDAVATAFLATSVAAALPGAVDLADGYVWRLDLDAVALLALSAAYAVLAGVVFARERDLSTALTGVALTLAGVGAALQLDGNWLVLAWAGGAGALAALSAAARELRFLLGSAVYLGLGLAHALALDAPPADLFVAQRHPGAGVPALVALVGAGLAFVAASRPRREPAAPADPDAVRALAYRLERGLPRWHTLALAGAALIAVYALSLTILELFQALPGVDVETAFQRGHTGVSAFWAVLALVLLYVGLVRRADVLRNAGLALFGVTLGKIFLYDLAALSAIARALSFLAVGALLLAAGFFYQRLSGRLDEREVSAP